MCERECAKEEREGVRAIHVRLFPRGAYKYICCGFDTYIIIICIYALFVDVEHERECVRASHVQPLPLPQVVYTCIQSAKQSAVSGSMCVYTCIHAYM